MSAHMLVYRLLRMIPAKIRWWVACLINRADSRNLLCWAELAVQIGLCDFPWGDWPHFSSRGCGGGRLGQCWCGKIERPEP